MESGEQNTQDVIDEYLAGVQEHVRNGKKILELLDMAPILCIPKSESEMGNRLFVGDVLATVHRGVAILEALLDIHAPQGAIPSALHSAIRQWKGFEDTF